MERTTDNKWFIWTTALLLTVLSVWIRGMVYPDNNHGQEVPGVLLASGYERWAGDLSAASFQGIGPRWFYQTFLSWFVFYDTPHLGALYHGLGWTALFLTFLGMVAGIHTGLATRFSAQERWSIAFLVGLAAMAPLHTWSIPILDPQPRPGTFAVAFVALSFWAAVSQRWALAWISMAIAAAFQFLVGFYGGITLGVAYLLMGQGSTGIIYRARLWGAIFLWTGVLGGQALGSMADTTEVDMVGIMGIFRVPHHWFVSTGTWTQWAADAGLWGAALYAWHRSPASLRTILTLCAVIASMGVLAAIVNTIGVDILHNPLVAQIQLQRALPFAQVAALVAILLAAWVHSPLSRAWTIAVLVAGLTSGLPGLLVWPLLLPHKRSAVLCTGAAFAAALLMGAWASWTGNFALQGAYAILGGTMIAMLGAYAVPQTRTSAAALLGATLVSIPLLYASTNRVEIDRMDALSMTEAQAMVAAHTAPTAVIAVPPLWAGQAESAPLAINRPVYVHAGNVPYTRSGLKEWHRRLSGLFAHDVTRLEGGLSMLEEHWRQMDAAHIEAWLAQEHVCWLLDNTIRNNRTWSFEASVHTWTLWRAPFC